MTAEAVAAASRRSSMLAPLIIGFALFMQTLDATVVSNALPMMARSLHEDPITLNLAITAYLLSMAVFMPISGWLADRFGAKTIFCAAIVGFAVSSLFCGLSRSLPELVLARVAQGASGAMMSPVGRLVLLRTVPKSELVRAMSYLTLPAMMGPVLGPLVGGFIVTYVSWRWIFFINIPVAVVGVLLVSLFIENIREAISLRFDWRGFVLTGFGLAGMVWGFENLGRGVLPYTVVLGLLAGGGVCLAAYAWHARRTPHAIMDLSVFGVPSFMASTVGGMFLRLSIGALPFLLALLLQMGFGLSALEAGAITFTSAAGAMFMKMTARPIIRWLGFKNVMVFDTVIVGVVFMAYGLFRATTPYAWIILTLLAGGFFRSLQFTALGALAFADVDQRRMAGASTLSSVAQPLSQSLGVGLAASLVTLLRHGHEAAPIRVSDVAPVFAIIGALSLVALAFFLPLPADVGAEVSGRRRVEEDDPAALQALASIED